MIGSTPSFHRVVITPELCRALEIGEEPAHQIVVYTCHPALPVDSHGMAPKSNRRIILQCYEAFKRFIPEDYTSYASVSTP
jgi:hypothetical protein